MAKDEQDKENKNKTPSSIEQRDERSGELNEEQLNKVPGGFNPQPDPPAHH